MPLSRADASAALAELTDAESRSHLLRGYQTVSPHMILWGVAWALAFTISDIRPAWTNAAWNVIVPVAVVGDIIASWTDRRSARSGMVAGLFVIVAIFVVSTELIMAPTDFRQVGAFIPLVVAGGYAILGLVGGAPRLLILGGALAALILFGFFALPAHFLLWMAVCGGGALILGGLWLRQV